MSKHVFIPVPELGFVKVISVSFHCFKSGHPSAALWDCNACHHILACSIPQCSLRIWRDGPPAWPISCMTFHKTTVMRVPSPSPRIIYSLQTPFWVPRALVGSPAIAFPSGYHWEGFRTCLKAQKAIQGSTAAILYICLP